MVFEVNFTEMLLKANKDTCVLLKLLLLGFFLEYRVANFDDYENGDISIVQE